MTDDLDDGAVRRRPRRPGGGGRGGAGGVRPAAEHRRPRRARLGAAQRRPGRRGAAARPAGDRARRRQRAVPLPPRRDRGRGRPGRPGAGDAGRRRWTPTRTSPRCTPPGPRSCWPRWAADRESAAAARRRPRRPARSGSASRRGRPGASAGQLHGQPLRPRPALPRPRRAHRRRRPGGDPDRAGAADDRAGRLPERRSSSPPRPRRSAPPSPTPSRSTVDGRPVDWQVGDTALETVPGAAGLPTLRLTCRPARPTPTLDGAGRRSPSRTPTWPTGSAGGRSPRTATASG